MPDIARYPLYNGEAELQVFPDDWPDRAKAHSYWWDGDRMPGVTTVSDCVSGPGKVEALMGWAVSLGVDGLVERFQSKPSPTPDEIETWREEAKGLHKAAKKSAADIGTAVHAYAEQLAKSESLLAPVPELPIEEQARNGAIAFLQWKKDHDVVFETVERPVLSRIHRFAGRMDMGTYEGKRVLTDLKSSNAFRESYCYQTAAYGCAWEEEFPDRKFDDRIVLMLNKTTGLPTEINLGAGDAMQEDYKAFLGALAVYRRSLALRDKMEEWAPKKKWRKKA